MLITVPASHAQCPTSREFGGQGNGMLTGRIIIDTTSEGFPNDGNEFTSVWDVENGSASFGSGDHVPTNPGACPNMGGTTGWYLTGTMLLGANAGIQGFIGTSGCFPVQCPTPGELIATLVEDEIGVDAGFILYTVENTPAEIRPYDHARTAGINGIPSALEIQAFLPYPRVEVTSSSGCFPLQTLTANYADLAPNYHGAGLTSAASPAIQSYDDVAHHGPSSPDRLRTSYNLGTIDSIPYADSEVVGHVFNAPCPTLEDDTYLSIGVTFVDPASGGLESILVGPPTSVECDPCIADPNAPAIQRAPQSKQQSLGHAPR